MDLKFKDYLLWLQESTGQEEFLLLDLPVYL